MGFPVGDQVDFMLPLLGLKAVLGSAVVADTAAAQDDDDGPHQPEPPEFICLIRLLTIRTPVCEGTCRSSGRTETAGSPGAGGQL